MNDLQGAEDRVRGALNTALAGKVDLSGLGASDNLFDAGMTSHQTVQVMLALEDEFDVEFPDDRLNKATFSSIGSMVEALKDLA
ncbi:hypothetical protein NCCP2495_01770 [Dietzia sp. NCCP-2495]|uniref:acyl carrier protein n=1 Tax=Dietzia sp. NCCP-2495 TaxID=2934675 RepID=UPI00223047F5|nr:acyl carrier protein [Dietzia sp. NCCP-2495]GLB62299.1 hypothetical protein NCCP2495_01770 [Dietzia sp. NCCP-2495]